LKQKKCKILCILPAFNEEGKIGRVVKKVQETGIVDEIVVADDCSADDTNAEALGAGATVIRHEKNLGVGAGIRSGLKYGVSHGFDIAVIMSGDDQHEPQELPAVLEPLLSGNAQFVQGSRRIEGGRAVNDRAFRNVSTRLFSLLFSLLTLTRITDGTNGFRAFYLSILEKYDFDIDQEWLNTYELEPYLLYKAVRNPEITVVERPITVYYRGSTREFSKMKPFRDWWRLARPVIFLRLGMRS
jgi:dolichol-phosphate mannosyltransferase